MLCKDVMLTLVYRCSEDTTVQECARLMRDQKIGFVPVVRANGELAGVVTDRDLTLRILAEGRSSQTHVSDVMSSGHLITCDPEMDLTELEELMAEQRVSRAVVMGLKGVEGVISLSDIAVAEPSAQKTGKLFRKIARRESVAITRA